MNTENMSKTNLFKLVQENIPQSFGEEQAKRMHRVNHSQHKYEKETNN